MKEKTYFEILEEMDQKKKEKERVEEKLGPISERLVELLQKNPAIDVAIDFFKIENQEYKIAISKKPCKIVSGD